MGRKRDLYLFRYFVLSIVVYIESRISSCIAGFLRNKIHQIMNMKNISAGKNTFYICLQTFVYHRSGSHIAQLHTCLSGKLILRDQTNRKKKRIAFKKFLCTGNRASVFVYLCKSDSFHTFFSFYVNHCMAKLQRDSKVIQALHDISLQASGIWHQFCHCLNLCTFQRHTSSHDQSDITRSQDHYFFSRHKSFHVYKALCCSC